MGNKTGDHLQIAKTPNNACMRNREKRGENGGNRADARHTAASQSKSEEKGKSVNTWLWNANSSDLPVAILDLAEV